MDNHFHLEIYSGVLRKHLSPDCLHFHWDLLDLCTDTPQNKQIDAIPGYNSFEVFVLNMSDLILLLMS